MMPRCPPHACHIVRVSRPIKVTFRPTGVPMWALRRHGGEKRGPTAYIEPPRSGSDRWLRRERGWRAETSDTTGHKPLRCRVNPSGQRTFMAWLGIDLCEPKRMIRHAIWNWTSPPCARRRFDTDQVPREQPWYHDYGPYVLADPTSNCVVAWGMDRETVARELTGTWQRCCRLQRCRCAASSAAA